MEPVLTYRASDIARVASDRKREATVFSLRSWARCKDSASSAFVLPLKAIAAEESKLFKSSKFSSSTALWMRSNAAFG
eukprot:scaffold1992_cov187-Amphora_coffeaeformis.AAC.7